MRPAPSPCLILVLRGDEPGGAGVAGVEQASRIGPIGVDPPLGVVYLQGRAQGGTFAEGDQPLGVPVAVVNETFARLYWPNQPAVGRSFYSGGFNAEPTEVIGVARDHRVRSVGEAPRPYVHVPYQPGRVLGFVVRTATPATT